MELPHRWLQVPEEEPTPEEEFERYLRTRGTQLMGGWEFTNPQMLKDITTGRQAGIMEGYSTRSAVQGAELARSGLARSGAQRRMVEQARRGSAADMETGRRGAIDELEQRKSAGYEQGRQMYADYTNRMNRKKALKMLEGLQETEELETIKEDF